MLNRTLGRRYVIEELLGEGGGGATYAARDQQRGDRVAIKLVATSDDARARALLGEFTRLRGLVHPHLARVRDFGVTHDDERWVYLAMELVDGEPLDRFATRGAYDEVLGALADAIGALGALHRLGVRHGDFKAANVMVTSDRRGVLIDLGASEGFSREGQAEISGTPGYIAPELFAGRGGDQRADLYAVGKTLSVLLGGVDAPPEHVRALAARLMKPGPEGRPVDTVEVLEALGIDRSRRIRAFSVPPRLVGRQREVAALESAFDALSVGASKAKAYWIRGDHGAGRSRLLVEAKWRAQLKVESLETSSDAARPVTDLVTKLTEQEGVGFFVALRSLASGRPRAIFVDDAHALPLDEAERLVAMIRSLAHDGPTLVVVASQEGPPAVPGIETLELDPLDVEAMAALVEGNLGIATAADVFRLTGGLPGRVVDVLDRVARGDIAETDLRSGTVSERSVTGPRAPLESADEKDTPLRAALRLLRFDVAADAQSLVEAAIVLVEAGRPAESLRVVARSLRLRGADTVRDRARWAGALGVLAAGDAARAVRIGRALEQRGGHAIRADALDVISRAETRLGRFVEAIDAARRGLSLDPGEATQGQLSSDLGIALGYAGEPAGARENLERATEIFSRLGRGRDEVRARIQHAIVVYRGGDATDAALRFESALERAEALDLPDLMVTAATNLGAARHQLGDLAAALDAYGRGLAAARAIGSVPNVVSVSTNLAKLYLDVGLFERAKVAAAEASREARAASMRAFEAFAESVRGEALLALGEIDAAAAALDAAHESFERDGARREAAEVDVERARVAWARGDAESAKRLVESATNEGVALGAEDVTARACVASGAMELARGQGAAAVAMLERGLELAQRASQRLVEAEAHAHLATALESRGAPVLAERHQLDAIAIWERTASALAPALFDAFWAHPTRRAARAHKPGVAPPPGREAKLVRLVALARRLSSSLDPTGVLELAVDAAIEFTGAERGFVLVRNEGAASFDLLAPRNMGKQSLEGGEIAFSRGIAERVIASVEPVITVDAQEDARFVGQRSIHAMRLLSVMSVPVRGRDGVLGALYLDHRFQRGAFETGDIDLVLALADHVAIALTNARLHAALDRRTRELEIERARVDVLYREKASEAERLSEEVRAQGEALAARFSGSRLIGRSPAMQAVFEKVERVSRSNVSVLVSGESGTGKELVARALHAGSARKGAFVAIHCGAIPESLLESELFGSRAGAFTGAVRDRTGLIERAHEGTLFLDEIGEMPLSLQVKLLRVLQEREVMAIGASEPTKVDIRVVAATHRTLREEIRQGSFREDLFYRLAVVEIGLPSLRERLDDLPFLARALVERSAKDLGREPPTIGRDAMAALVRHDWPGNVRELENVAHESARSRAVRAHPRLRTSSWRMRRHALQRRRSRDARTRTTTRPRSSVPSARRASTWPRHVARSAFRGQPCTGN